MFSTNILTYSTFKVAQLIYGNVDNEQQTANKQSEKLSTEEVNI